MADLTSLWTFADELDAEAAEMEDSSDDIAEAITDITFALREKLRAIESANPWIPVEKGPSE